MRNGGSTRLARRHVSGRLTGGCPIDVDHGQAVSGVEVARPTLFGRLAPGATLDEARAEMSTVHAAMMRAHPDAYSQRSHVQVGVARLRDQIASPARTIPPWSAPFIG